MKFGKIRMRQAALCLALAANLGGSKIPPPDLPGNQLRSITTLKSGHQVVVTFHAEGDYKFEKFELENPKRLVIDLIRLRNAVRPNIIRINSESLNQINVTQLRNQNPPITRVTMNLAGSNSGYTVSRQGPRIQVVIGAAGAKTGAAASAKQPGPAPAAVAVAVAKETAAEVQPEVESLVKEPAQVPVPSQGTVAPPPPAPAAARPATTRPAEAQPDLAELKPSAAESTPVTKLPAVDSSSAELFRTKSLKLNPKQIRVRPYMERPFGTASSEAAPTVDQPAPPEAAPVKVTPAAANLPAPVPPVIENAVPTTQAMQFVVEDPEPARLPGSREVPLDSIQSALNPATAQLAATLAAAFPAQPAPAALANTSAKAAAPAPAAAKPAAKPKNKSANSGSTRTLVSPARNSSRPIRITTIDPGGTVGVSRTLTPQEAALDLPPAPSSLPGATAAPTAPAPSPTKAAVNTPAPQAQSIENPPPAGTPSPTALLSREPVPVQAEKTASSYLEKEELPPPAPVVPASQPAPAAAAAAETPTTVALAVPAVKVPAPEPALSGSTPEISPAAETTAPPAPEPAAVVPKKAVPVQMSPEAALNIALSNPGASSASKLPPAKSLKRLPASKPPARPAAPAPASPNGEPAGLPQQLAALRPEPRKTGAVALQAHAEAPNNSQYSGEAIDLKVKDLDLADFFRMMSEISGLNISVDPDVGGKITMNMGAVPWDQIFDLALVTHRLDKKIDGNVVRVARKETLQAEETAKKTMKQAVEDAQDTQYMSFRLNYSEAKVLSESLKEHLSARGQVIFDERTNTIIVSDLPKKIQDINQLVKTLDVPEPQVIIESRIVQATRNFAREIGVNLGFVSGNGQRVTAGAPPLGTTQIPGLLNPNVNLPASRANGVLGIKVGNIFDTFLLDAAITAGEQKGIAKLLSEPKVTAQNNREATIRQGVRFPVQVVQNNTVSVIFQDAALTLKVTPKITDAGTVLLSLRVENNVADFTRSVNGIPSIQTSESETRVLVPSGGTTVIGGILVDEDRNTDDKVPGIASVPILGHLFKRRSTEKRTQEVLFFVTPRIDR